VFFVHLVDFFHENENHYHLKGFIIAHRHLCFSKLKRKKECKENRVEMSKKRHNKKEYYRALIFA
jgi:hypothetical protein